MEDATSIARTAAWLTVVQKCSDTEVAVKAPKPVMEIKFPLPPKPRIRCFPLEDILSITTGRKLSDHIDELLGYMTQDIVWSHQWAWVAEECRPYVLLQYPQLALIDADAIDPENWSDQLLALKERFGRWLELVPMPAGTHKQVNPLAELEAKIGKGVGQ